MWCRGDLELIHSGNETSGGADGAELLANLNAFKKVGSSVPRRHWNALCLYSAIVINSVLTSLLIFKMYILKRAILITKSKI